MESNQDLTSGFDRLGYAHRTTSDPSKITVDIRWTDPVGDLRWDVSIELIT